MTIERLEVYPASKDGIPVRKQLAKGFGSCAVLMDSDGYKTTVVKGGFRDKESAREGMKQKVKELYGVNVE